MAHPGVSAGLLEGLTCFRESEIVLHHLNDRRQRHRTISQARVFLSVPASSPSRIHSMHGERTALPAKSLSVTEAPEYPAQERGRSVRP